MEFFKLLNKVSPGKTLLILGMSLLYGISSGLFPVLVMRAVIAILAGAHYDLYVVALPLLVVILVGSKGIAQHVTGALSEAAVEDLTLRIADTVRHEELPAFEQRDPSALYLGIVDARRITNAVTRSVDVTQQFIAVFTGWLYIFSRSRPAGVLMLGAALLQLLLHEAVRTVARDHFRKAARMEGTLFSLFHHLLEGFKEIKIHRLKHDELYAGYLAPCVRKLRHARYLNVIWNLDYVQGVEATSYLVLAADVFMLSAIHPSPLIAELVVVSLYLFKPVWVILMALPLLTQGDIALTRLHRLAAAGAVDAGGDRPEAEHPQEPPSFTTITLRDVRFRYHDHAAGAGFAVGPLNLDITRGDLVFIAGGNGSGKTTLMKLLTSLYPPESGAIELDGAPVRPEAYRSLFATVFTDFHLFDALYGISTVDEDRLDHLLRYMELSRKTAPTAEGFDTLDLSTGQRKRLALIVSLLEDKPVYVFDEWAADQDPHFRHYFYETILPQLQAAGKTILAVTHDDQFYHLADRVILMEEGGIADVWDPRAEPERMFGRVGETGTESHWHSPASGSGSGDQAADASGNGPEEAPAEEAPVLDWRHFTPALYRLGRIAIVNGGANALRTYLLFEAVTLESKGRMLVSFAVVFILSTVTARQFNAHVVQLTEELIGELRLKIVNSVRRTGLLSFEQFGAEHFYTALTTDMLAVSEVSRLVAITFRLVARALGLFVVLAIFSPKIFLFEMLLLGGVGLVYAYNQVRIKESVDLVHDGEIRFSKTLTALVEGFKELRLNRRKNDDFFQRGLVRAYSRLKQANLTSLRYLLLNYMLVYGAFMGTLALLPLLLPVVPQETLGTVTNSLGILLSLPVLPLIEFVPRILLAAFSVRRLVDVERRLHTLSPEPGEVPSEARITPFSSLRYQDMAFQYPARDNHPFSVGPVNLSVQPGEILFLTGGNGSGKTTVFKLLAGLYQADAGTVLLNGQAIDIRQHRYLFAAIFSDAHLFDRLYGLTRIDEDRVKNLLRLMQIEQKAQYAERQFSTTDLSTGQKKRLALICAVLEDRPIYLFDEWAAGQDPYFRHYFYETLLPQFKAQGKTVIAVTHDDRYFQVADRIVRLEYGQLVEG